MITAKTQHQVINAISKAGKAILDIYESGDFGVEMKSDHSPLTLADKAAHDIIMEVLSKTEEPVLSEEGSSIPYSKRKDWKAFWLVDPLDGTKEFIKKNGEFTINVAYIERGRARTGFVYAPVLEDFYLGINEQMAFKFKLKPGETFKELPATAKVLKVKPEEQNMILVGSRSHFNKETEDYIEALKATGKKVEFISKGSSLKLCMVAEGSAHLYPRFGPTMEWDTAAAHAIVSAAGGTVKTPEGLELHYNKEDLLNPYFIVKR
ncbi:3'(2'),5'-bisphosphate nucleotidase CysQ [Lentimicrobium sp. S6]|uniref:3'(2'),5'-bisphosphate nucleotidase CysQ n=1 Tax=Lentimicrobium sp. S6 TaxID=2735872 RepID=UPI00155448DF|nr:3'(2'),5'-bisphosphate nucleotidase CysQ [Lentimicrobium sp. S6]NPD47936.1 3'(2'),5'-bisphosphate nucleotidase CysQ [Lentimicrobium sp. S6]